MASNSDSKPNPNPPRELEQSELDRLSRAQAVVEKILGTRDVQIYAGHDAGRVSADLAEVRAQRTRRSRGGKLFKRRGSPYWHLRYRQADRWIDESSGVTQKAAAQRMLDSKVYQASAGTLPGTASFEQIIEHLILDAEARRRKGAPRLARAGTALCGKLRGHRAEQINSTHWLKYIEDRRAEHIADATIDFELWVARRAYRVARADRLVATVPEIRSLGRGRVRAGFIEPRDWTRVREHLRSADFRDACDFAFLSGARQMEVLSLEWSDVTDAAINLRKTKTDRPRVVPYAEFPHLAEVIERRHAVRAALKRAGIIARWHYCALALLRAGSFASLRRSRVIVRVTRSSRSWAVRDLCSMAYGAICTRRATLRCIRESCSTTCGVRRPATSSVRDGRAVWR
jgi:integrase